MRKKRPEIYMDPAWASRAAPVVPPDWIVAGTRASGMPIYWQNDVYVGHDPETMKIPDIYHFPFVYRTEIVNDEVVTVLCPGSAIPVAGWLEDRT